MPQSFFSILKFVTVAGVGLFGDGYLNLSIGLVVPMLGYLYFEDSNKGKIPTLSGDLIKACLSIGMIVGQLTFGIFGDSLGRHKIYGKELIFTLCGALAVILMPWGNFSTSSVVTWMGVFRVITGFGTGGDYPMTSAYAAEQTFMRSRAKLILTVFSCIGLGGFTTSLVYLILISAFKTSIQYNLNNLQWVWRLLLGIGMLPLACTLYYRLVMAESKPYEQYVATETSLTAPRKRGLADQFRDFREYFGCWRHAKVLLATSLTWFLFDIAYYGINLNQSIILSKIGYGKGATPYVTLHNTAVGSIIVQCAGYLPGFYIAIFLPDILGRVRQQFIFSLAVAVVYAIWAGVSDIASTGGLITLFTISQLLINAGPNATTFLIPAEVFPTRVRGTAHGISAASGKAGALLTALAFGSVTDSIGLRGVLGLFSGIMVLCAAVTLLIPETKGRSLEDVEEDLIYSNTWYGTTNVIDGRSPALSAMSGQSSTPEKFTESMDLKV